MNQHVIHFCTCTWHNNCSSPLPANNHFPFDCSVPWHITATGKTWASITQLSHATFPAPTLSVISAPRPQTHTANNGLSGFWCSFLCHSHNLMANSRWQPLCPDTTLQRSWPLATAKIVSGQLHLCHPLFLGLNLLHHLFYVRNVHSGK